MTLRCTTPARFALMLCLFLAPPYCAAQAETLLTTPPEFSQTITGTTLQPGAATLSNELAHSRFWLGSALGLLFLTLCITVYVIRVNRRLLATHNELSLSTSSPLPYDQHQELKRRAQQQWVRKLQRALNENRFRLYCEPYIPLKPNSASVRHFEILLRLIDHDGREILPMNFIPAAETYQLMPAIDRWVVTATFAAIAAHPAHVANTVFAINLSGQSLGDEKFLDFLIMQFQKSKIDPAQICFEITETAAIANMPSALQLMSVLRGMGCRFALDDFGSGLSSFAYLKNLPVDYLKIDGSFIREGLDNPISYAIVDSINQIGHVMGLKTVAECVTDANTLERIKSIGADYAQGYGLAVAIPLEAMMQTSPSALPATRVA